MNKQKFFERLGITAGEWKCENGIIKTSDYRPDAICQMFDSFDGDYCNAKQNSNLICAAPDMLIALIKITRIQLYISSGIVYTEIREAIKAIEESIGKTWEDVLTIWNECQEDDKES